ncbi:hypothetical protein GCM10007887_39490 [Methylobacterium haplocladii]|nr:hypothetical protein GCM10007887_39490 [Methylobacterium haplocladii]
MQREVEDFGVAGDVARDNLQQVPGGLFGLVPGIPAKIEKHQSGYQEHADGCQNTERDPGTGGVEFSCEADWKDHRRTLPGGFVA